MNSPAADRAEQASAFASTQLLSSPLGGINRLVALVKSQPDAFATWASHPVTRAFLDALHPLAMNPNAIGMRTDSILVQYGVSQGVMLAYQLCTDPAGVLNVESPEAEKTRVDLLQMAPDYNTPPPGMELTEDELSKYGIGPARTVPFDIDQLAQ
jgi:hypothetical protein